MSNHLMIFLFIFDAHESHIRSYRVGDMLTTAVKNEGKMTKPSTWGDTLSPPS